MCWPEAIQTRDSSSTDSWSREQRSGGRPAADVTASTPCDAAAAPERVDSSITIASPALAATRAVVRILLSDADLQWGAKCGPPGCRSCTPGGGALPQASYQAHPMWDNIFPRLCGACIKSICRCRQEVCCVRQHSEEQSPGESGREALLRSVEAACRSPSLQAGRGLAAATVADAAAVLQHRRPPVLCALTDAQRILSAGKAATSLASSQPQAAVRQAQKGLRKRLSLGSRKISFMLSWANELRESEYVALHQLAGEEAEHHK